MYYGTYVIQAKKYMNDSRAFSLLVNPYEHGYRLMVFLKIILKHYAHIPSKIGFSIHLSK